MLMNLYMCLNIHDSNFFNIADFTIWLSISNYDLANQTTNELLLPFQKNNQTKALGFDLESTATLTSSWLMLMIWSLFPTHHFFMLLLIFETTFAGLALDLVALSVENLNTDGLIMAVIVMTFAALESVVGLSFLVFMGRTCLLSNLTVSF